MIDTKALEKYIESRDTLRAGDQEQALTLLAESLGEGPPTPYMRASLDQLVEPNPVALTLILHKSTKK